uniref:Uncharacterized protein n=1 Tax=Oryza glumipatula TaxID=40148 RepID=A0A0E0BRS1_9ORYZ
MAEGLSLLIGGCETVEMHAHGNGTTTVATKCDMDAGPKQREAASDGRGEDEGALRSRFGTWDSWWSSVPGHPMTAHDRVAPGTRWFLGCNSVEQRGNDPSVHEQQKNMAVMLDNDDVLCDMQMESRSRARTGR